MRFLLDMGVSHLVATWLREQGHDAVHLREQGLQRLPDEEVLAKAAAEDRCLMTMDLDFAYLMAIGHGCLPTVIIFRLEDETAANVIRRMSLVLSHHRAELEAGSIFSIDERTVRARPLPI